MIGRFDKYVHEQPCGCTNCDAVREQWHTGPGLYKAIPRDPRTGGGSMTTTWTLDRFVWGEQIESGELIYVVRDLVPGEKGYDHWHPCEVLIIPLDGKGNRFARAPHMCTKKKWIEPA